MSHRQLQGEAYYTSVARKLAYTAILSLAFGLLSSSIVDAFLKKWSGTAFDAEVPYSLERTLAYEAPRPYAYRVLVPWLVNRTTECLPSDFLLSPPPEILRRGVALYIGEQAAKMIPVVLQVKFVITVLWMFVFLFATLWLYRTIAIRTLHINRVSADLAVLLFGLFLPLSFRGGGGFIYDFSELFFSAAYIATLLSGRYMWSAIILVGAVVNKESNLLLLLYLAAYILTDGRSLKGKVALCLGHSIAAAVPYSLIKIAMMGQSGGTVEFNLPWNVEYWTRTSSYLGFLTTNLQLAIFPKPANIAFLAVFAWLIGYRWMHKPLFVRAALVSTGLLCIVLLAVFCWHDEIRNLSLAFPAIFLTITHSVVENYRTEQSSKPTPPVVS